MNNHPGDQTSEANPVTDSDPEDGNDPKANPNTKAFAIPTNTLTPRMGMTQMPSPMPNVGAIPDETPTPMLETVPTPQLVVLGQHC